MKENTENNNRRLKVYWGVREWLHSMYPTYLKWLILPLILIMLIGLDKQTDETIVNTITSSGVTHPPYDVALFSSCGCMIDTSTASGFTVQSE